jgi:hypothetical protein
MMVDEHFVVRVRQVLLKEWDPIGVADVPAAHDEYDMYAPEIARSVIGGATAESLAASLVAIETERMGLSADESRADRVARQLAALR